MCGHTEILHQNNKRFFLDNIKKVVIFATVILKKSFYLKKLIPIEDIERLLVKAIALFFYIFITNNKYFNELQVLNVKNYYAKFIIPPYFDYYKLKK